MSGLIDHLRRRITHEGPLPISEYMAEALGNPNWGYYMGRDPFGRAGDFITAPEISQMFGELVGLWCAERWQAMGRPKSVGLVELGPGRGVLMRDILRAGRMAPGFNEAVRIYLVETSPALRKKQEENLGSQPSWRHTLDEVPRGPILILANEFFDALPIRQYVRTLAAWQERLVGLGAEGEKEFCFTLSGPLNGPPPGLCEALLAAPDGKTVEDCPAGRALACSIGGRLARDGGAALIIDYGHAQPGAGDTIQAIKGHAYHAPLADPGEADLTAHVDFHTLACAAKQGGAAVFGPVSQGPFLESLGLSARARTLLAGATPKQAQDIRAAHARLAAPEAMGRLFKVLALQHPDLPPPLGLL